MAAIGKNLYFLVISVMSCMAVTSCTFRPASVTVLDDETGKPVVGALVFAYSHEYVALPRQRLYVTDADGKTETRVPPLFSLWAGKKGYYPYYQSITGRGFLFWQTCRPAVVRLQKVGKGDPAEAKKARRHRGIIFHHRNPPGEKDLLKILEYSYWVCRNTAFYNDAARAILEEYFRKYSFPPGRKENPDR